MSHKATETRFAVSGTIWIMSSAESAVMVLLHTWLTDEQGRMGDTGEGLTPGAPMGPPQLTWRSLGPG
jgi:hypothetical protein